MKLFIPAAIICLALLGASGATSSAQAAKPQCMDRVDNDGDGKIDYPADPGCTAKNDQSEIDVVQPPPPPPPGDTTSPSAPTGFVVSNLTQTGFGLSWNPSTDNVGVTGYDKFLNGNQVGIGPDTFHTYSGLTCGTTYTPGADAYDAAGNHSTRSTINVTTANCTTPPSGAWFSNNFEGSIQTDVTTSPFIPAWNSTSGEQYTYNSNYFQPTTGYNGQGLALSVDAAESSASGGFGPLSSVFMQAVDAHTSLGEETWYRVKFKIPTTGFVAGYGEFGWIWEWHESLPCDGNSIAFGLIDFHDGNPPTGINNMQLRFRPMGGNGNSPTSEDWVLPWPGQVIQPGHWYDIVLKVNWDTRASNAGGTGSFSMWIDGAPSTMRRIVSTSNGDGQLWSNPHPFPTLYTDGCSGAVDHPTHGLYNYRPPLASGSSTIDFDEWTAGPSASSIGFAP